MLVNWLNAHGLVKDKKLIKTKLIAWYTGTSDNIGSDTIYDIRKITKNTIRICKYVKIKWINT